MSIENLPEPFFGDHIPFSTKDFADKFRRIGLLEDRNQAEKDFKVLAADLVQEGIAYYYDKEEIRDKKLSGKELDKWKLKRTEEIEALIVTEWKNLKTIIESVNKPSEETPEEEESWGRPVSRRMAEVTGSQIAAVPLYNGESDVELFAVTVDRIMRQFNWNENQTSAIAKNKLTGAAAGWLRSAELQFQKLDEWKDLKEGLFKRFKPALNEVNAVASVLELKQKEKESVMEFYDRVIVAIDRMNHKVKPAEKREKGYQDLFEVQLFTFFSAGMKEDIRIKAMSGKDPPTTAEEMRTAAQTIEAQGSKQKQALAELGIEEVTEKMKKAKIKKEEEKNEDQEEGVEALQVRGRRGRGGGARGQGRKSQKEVTCFNCQQKGHYSFDCQRKPAQRGRGRGNFRGGNGQNRGGANWRPQGNQQTGYATPYPNFYQAGYQGPPRYNQPYFGQAPRGPPRQFTQEMGYEQQPPPNEGGWMPSGYASMGDHLNF